MVKPQSAFFEVFGSGGIRVLERVLGDLRDAGTLILLDVKRGDIGSTMQAYAEAYLGKDSELRADAVTVSPFLGYGSLRPRSTWPRRPARGVRAGAHLEPRGAVQHAVATADRWRHRSSRAPRRTTRVRAARASSAVSGWSSAPPSATRSTTWGSTWSAADTLLAPGFGAQGGTVEALRPPSRARCRRCCQLQP